LCQHPPRFPVILASTNGEGVARMQQALSKARWQTRRVIPFDDLAWVAGEWWTAVRDGLVGLAEPPRRALGTVPSSVAALVSGLLVAAPGPLEPTDERLLRRW